MDLNEWIKVFSFFFQLVEFLDFLDVFIIGEIDVRIEVVLFYFIFNKNIERWNKECFIIVFLFIFLYIGLEMSSFCNQENVYIVFYLDYSLFDEFIEFVKFIKLGCIYFIVCGEIRGLFGFSIFDRVNIFVFEFYFCNK